MRLRFVLAWYDLWVGAYWNRKARTLYVLPLPCIGFAIEFPPCEWCDTTRGVQMEDVQIWDDKTNEHVWSKLPLCRACIKECAKL